MYICQNCGAKYDHEVSFCGACGNRVVPMAAPVAPPVYNPAPAPTYNPTPAPAYNPAPAAPVYNPAPAYAAPEAPAAPVYNSAPAYAAPEAPAEDKKPKLASLFSFIGGLLQIVTGFFALLALALPYIRVSINSGYYSGYYAYGYHYTDTTCSVFALIFGLMALGLSVVSFIFSLKGSDTETKFSKIKSVAASTLLTILSIVLVSNVY